MPQEDLASASANDGVESRQSEDVSEPAMARRRTSEASTSMKPNAASPTAEASPAAQARRSRGPNPNTDYKMHFVRQKEKFDTVSEDNITRKRELTRASLKQLKLNDELEFLLDAIAGEMHRRRLINQGQLDATDVAKPAPAKASNPDSRQKQDKAKDEGQESATATSQKPVADKASTEKSSLDDDELLKLAEDDSDGEENEESEAGAPLRSSHPEKGQARASARTSMKRQRSFSESADTDDELLEAAGLSSPASKRARNA